MCSVAQNAMAKIGKETGTKKDTWKRVTRSPHFDFTQSVKFNWFLASVFVCVPTVILTNNTGDDHVIFKIYPYLKLSFPSLHGGIVATVVPQPQHKHKHTHSQTQNIRMLSMWRWFDNIKTSTKNI